ncbi:DUF4349 domain-containing protein [Tenacibaculum sp. TC6]|uniref:DUF4349 domain-containing protein n=1 Tax=Tenacibaculum sp. TC6 TaxID=3423223 RepID=UPI003D367029
MKYIIRLFLALVLIGCKERASLGYGRSETISDEVTYQANSSVLNEEEDTDKSITERKLIKNGTLEFEVEDLSKAREKILKTVTDVKGYISSDEEATSSYRSSNYLTIRIPANNFDNFLNTILNGVEKFDQKKITVNDVTEQYLDVETRLKNKRILEEKYREILKKAKSVKEILEVEKELSAIREEIEAAEGKLKYLQNQVSFSTVYITIYKELSSQDSFMSNIGNGFKNGVENLKMAAVFLVNIWPFLILLILLLYWFKKKKQKKSTTNN